TSFKLKQERRALQYSRDYELGISCEKCHGDGHQHVQYQSSHPADARGKYIINPAHFSRERKVDNCALCHSGLREQIRAPFTYRPGEKLDDYLSPASDAPIPDVHGDRVGLLRRSQCFRSIPTMSCSAPRGRRVPTCTRRAGSTRYQPLAAVALHPSARGTAMPACQWARLKANANHPLRRGAWYRILKLTASHAIVEVKGKPLPVPRGHLQLSPTPGLRWAVVAAPQNAPRFPSGWGQQYAV